MTIKDVYEKLYVLTSISGDGVVKEKTEILAQLFKDIGKNGVRYAVRIPLATLRLGIGDPTILDALSFAHTGDKSIRKELEQAYNRCSDLGLVAKTLFIEGKEKLKNLKLL